MIRKIAVVLLALTLMGCKPDGVGDAEAGQGMLLIEQREFDKAIPLLESALEKGLKNYPETDVLTSIGNCYNELEDYDKALTFHDKALAADSTNYHAYVNKGVVYRLQGDFVQAEKCYLKALSMEPDYAELHASMGALAFFQNDTEKAIKHLKRAVDLDDSLAVAHSNLSMAYASDGRFDEADSELKKAVDRGYHQPELIRERIETMRANQAGSEQEAIR